MAAKFNQLTLAGTSPAAPSTAVLGGASNVIGGLDEADWLHIVATVTGATGGTLDVYLQISPDAGTTWVDYIHFPQLAAAAAAVSYSYTSALNNALTVVGTALVPALAANSAAGGWWGKQMRAVCVAGAGTVAGAVQTMIVTGVHRRD